MLPLSLFRLFVSLPGRPGPGCSKWRSSTPCWECKTVLQPYYRFLRLQGSDKLDAFEEFFGICSTVTCEFKGLDNVARDVLENCQEAFSFVRMQLTNFQELVAGQIFEDLVQEFKVPQSLRNQFEENWDICIALDLGQRNWGS